MNSRRSYLETLNAGRQRRAPSSMEQLNRSLETLEQRMGRSPDRQSERREPAPEPVVRQPLPAIDTSRWEPPARRFEQATEPRAPRAEARPGDNDTSYRTLARDFERIRNQEDGVAAASRIANELKGLREELRQQMTTGLKREFDALRGDIERAYRAPVNSIDSSHLNAEFDRLSQVIQSMSKQTDDKNIKLLRLELEQVRGALDSLAREDTVRSVDRRWDEFDRRFTKFEDRFDAQSRGHDDGSLDALSQRLDEINRAVNSLPESLSLRSLEDKVRTLAGAVDHFTQQADARGNAPVDLIEERLDEISRAIVASTNAAQAPHFDPEPFERIEARITSLARQIEELVDDRPTVEVIDRLNFLSQRVDEIAAHGRLPDQSVERLAMQVATIADKLDQTPAPDTERLFRGIEQRFDSLSHLLDRKQGDANEQSQMVLRDLEGRLEMLATRLDARNADPALDSRQIMNAIDDRFEALTRRLESQAGAPEHAISNLEARLEDITTRLENARAPVAAVDPDIIRNLEAQVAELSQHLSRPSAALRDYDDIAPRLDDIERSLADNRQTLVEAARQAAESAVYSFSGPRNEAVVALAGDLKSLEDLTRRSDERNTKTFEAIHDTLLKIVDRLGSLEDNRSRAPAELPRKLALADAPSIEPSASMPIANDLSAPAASREVRDVSALKRSPAEAAAQAAVAAMDETIERTEEPSGRVRSMLGGLSRAFAKKEKPQPQAKTEPTLPGMAGEAPTTEIDRPLDQPLDPKIANQPLEPGSGAPDLNAIMRRVRDERGQPRSGNDAAKSDFIAAARRAAQAAAAEAQVTKKTTDIAGTARNLKIGDLLRSKRKPIMVGAIVVLLALAGLQLGKAFFNDGAEIAAGEPAIEPMIEDAAAATSQEIADTERPVRMADAPADDATEGQAQETMSLQEPVTANATGFEAVETTDSVPASDEAVAAQTEDPAVAPQPVPEMTAAVTTQPVEEAKAGDATKPAIVTEAVPAEAGPVMLREAADAGDPKAMFEVGSRYAEGRGGLKTDMKTAAKWYERAAELGLAPAQYRIGNLYEKGNGVARDLAKAKTWYQMAAEQGNASAMHNLAVLFATGADGTTDNDSAARWFGQAAELGVKDSQFNLGILSARGVGMPQNLEESYKWFALVAKTGDRDAAAKRDDIAKALRPEQLTNARAATELWKAKPVNAETNTVSVPDAWRESEDAKTASIDMKKAIRNIQAILNKNGYDAGSADGVMGAKTKEAIAAFQRANGMDATGEIDEKLVRKLLEKK